MRAVVVAALALVGCGASPGVPSDTAIAAYAAEQYSCVDQADSGPEWRACRDASRARFCARFPKLDTCNAKVGAP